MVEWVLFFYRITEEDDHDKVTWEPTPKGIESEPCRYLRKEYSKQKDQQVHRP